MATFFKICPNEMIYRHNETDGYTILTNRSLIYWMHLDSYDEQDIRGLEINAACIDQAEEIAENIYLVLDSRIGRWDRAIVPDHLLLAKTPSYHYKEIDACPAKSRRELIEKYTGWPRNKWGKFLVNNYMDVLCNVADDDELHWTFRRYNPESPERQPGHFYIHRKTDDDLNDERTIQQIKLRDPEWVDKYYYGKRGTSRAKIHHLDKMSVINPDDYDKKEFDAFLDTLKKRAALFCILDHGETGVTVAGWAAALNNIHVFYREYYVTSTLISINRQNITDLTGNEEIANWYCDPSIFKKTRQKEGGFYSVADEYMDTEVIQAPPIYWQPADNNEFATRNRINELLMLSPRYMHPITKISPAPALYFIQKTQSYPYGCDQIQTQLKMQKRQLLGTDNGKNIFSDERDEHIVDHAYDLVRYYVAMHNTEKPQEMKKPPKRSFAFFNKLTERRRRDMELGYFNR